MPQRQIKIAVNRITLTMIGLTWGFKRAMTLYVQKD